jgi:hypothetical protein
MMKNKLILLVLVAVCALVISSCNKNKLTDFEKFVNNIYNSELKLASYSEVSSINDNGTEVYNKSTLFKLTRGTKTVTEVKTVEKKLSVSGTTMYDETTESYKTIDNIKYTICDI